MKLDLFKTLWGHLGDLESAIWLCREADYQGLEGPAPGDAGERSRFFELMAEAGLKWIAEISTCTRPGVYVPLPGRSVEDHLESLEAGVVRSLDGKPCFINAMAGYDGWSSTEAIRFFEGVVRLQDEYGIIISVETHRGRPTYNPWQTRDILLAVPDLRITCDFSHWCVVTERLILEEESGILDLVARHAHHIQPRVGYAQGPQSPDPRAPEYLGALEAHERWWIAVWDSMAERGFVDFTMTPEFGPDGYLQSTPFTQRPVADLAELNRWIGHRQRERFSHHFKL